MLSKLAVATSGKPLVRDLDLSAFAAHAGVGYTFDAGWLPRIGLAYNYGSGDGDPTDGDIETFQNLFPTNHKFYGYMDLSSLQNLHDIRLAYTIKPTNTSMIALEGHTHFLDRTSDYWYNIAGAPRNVATVPVGSGAGYRINPTYGRHVGNDVARQAHR